MATFAQSISESGSLQLIGVIANCSGILSAALSFYSFYESEQEPSSADILNAIQQLQQTLNEDFNALGDLIQQQTQIIVNTVNRDGMAAALANSDVATAAIQDYLTNTDPAALESAKSASVAGVSFFTELDLSSYADLLFFLPGLVKAGLIRIFVIASEPAASREPISVIQDNMSSMINLLTNMIETIEATVDAAHIVVEKSHTIQCPIHAQIRPAAEPAIGAPSKTVTVIDGYSHEERGEVLAFFDAQQGTMPCEQPSPFIAGALADAKQARQQGVTDELAYIGIPYFQQVLNTWNSLLTVSTLFDLNGTWNSGGAPGPVITVNGVYLTVDMAAYNRPTATGMILDDTDITVTFPDDNAYTAKLQLPNVLEWSNNSSWIKS